MKKSILPLFASLFSISVVFGQQNMIDTASISNYVCAIDANTSLVRKISEGNIISKKHKVLGGFGIDTYSDKNKDSVYKICYHDNTNKNIYFTFYYYRNNVVFAEARLEKDGIGRVICSSRQYFHDGRLLVKINKGSCKRYKERVDEGNLLLRGAKILADEIKNQSEEKSILQNLDH